MPDTEALLERITALRQRLEQARGLVDDARTVAATLDLERRVQAGGDIDLLLDATLGSLEPIPEAMPLPARLTARARRLLETAQRLWQRLRPIGDDLERLGFAATDADARPIEADEPIALWYAATVAMTEAALRMIGGLPESTGTQARLADGVEAVLDHVAARADRLTNLIADRRRDERWIDTLAGLLQDLAAGKAVGIRQFGVLCKALVDEFEEGAPHRWFLADSADPARFIACHSLNVAQIMARVIRHDPEWTRRGMDALLAALVHDAGMLRVPAEVLTLPGPLDDARRRVVESHPWQGAELAGRVLPGEAWLTEAIAQHHERPDGTGYPAGLSGAQIAPLARLLAACDTYAALCQPRPHRPARDTRTALADILLLAEDGAVDKTAAEQLLDLSFYPPGTIVELADGTLAVVAGAPHLRMPARPDRPVVAVLTDAHGKPLAFPRLLDLAGAEGTSLVRSLPRTEYRDLLGEHFPELAA